MWLSYLESQMRNKFYIIWIWIFLWPNAAFGDYPKLWNVPLQNENFVGRAQELEQIRTAFKKSKGFQYMAITGLAGMGKTQLAKQFCHQNYASYNIVWWFDGSKNLSDQFKNFAEEWNRYNPTDPIPINDLSLENLVNYVKNKLRLTPHSWLLVFDNVENKSVEKYFPQRHGGAIGHIVVTSKNATGWLNSLSLTKFSRSDALKLLKKVLGDSRYLGINELAEVLNDYPLSVMQAAAYIKTHPTVSVQDYKKMYQAMGDSLKSQRDLAMSNTNLLDSYENADASAIKISLIQIQKVNSEAYEILLLLAHPNNKEISNDLLSQWSQFRHYKSDYNALINVLLEQSLIETNTDVSDTTNLSYDVHEIVQKVARGHSKKEDREIVLRRALTMMFSNLDNGADKLVSYLLKNSAVLYHMQHLVKHAKDVGLTTPEFIGLRVKLLECYLSGIRDYALAEAELLEIEQMKETVSFPNILSEAQYLINKGNFSSWKLADADTSILQMRKAYDLLKKTDGYADEKLRILTNIAQSEALRY